MSGPLCANGDVSAGFKISFDGRRVVYRADQEIDEVRELFVTYDRWTLHLPVIRRQ